MCELAHRPRSALELVKSRLAKPENKISSINVGLPFVKLVMQRTLRVAISFWMDIPSCVSVTSLEQMPALQIFRCAAADNETNLFVEQDDLACQFIKVML